MKLSKILNKLPDFFLAQLLSLSFVLALTTSLGLSFPHLYIYLMILAATALFSIAFINRRTAVAAGLLAGLAVAFGIYIIVFRTGVGKFADFLDDYFYWLSDFIANSGTPDPAYQLITVIALCAATAFLTYLFTIKKFIFYIPLVTGSAIFVIQWSFNMTSAMLPFYLFLPGILILYLKHVHAGKCASTPNEYLGSSRFTLWILPVCVAAVLLAASIHASDKPIEWKWLDKKINSLYNYFNKKFDYEVFDYFSVSSSGFGGKDNLLGGRVRLNKTLVLRVQTPHNVYLKGVSKDTYTGTKWVTGSSEMNTIGSDYSSLYEDTNEMLVGMKLLTDDPSYLDNLFYKDKVNITFQNLKTKSLFIPSKTFAFTPGSGNIIGITDANGSLSVQDRLNKGFKYSLELYSPKLGSEEFANALRKSREGLYDEYLLKAAFPSYYFSVSGKDLDSKTRTASAASEENSGVLVRIADPLSSTAQQNISIKEISELRAFRENARNIESKYLQLPQSLPQRVRDLAISITASSDNRYDKVKSIEQYLAGSFPYNLDVRTTPRNRDFVDYFIFDLKQGYCTYYASALTVLARSAGIPARYVEGYILPPKPLENDSTTYLVSNMQAHAWAEVYFEGYGWLPFEPTSPFRSSFYSDSSIQASISGEYSSAYEDYMDIIRRYSQGSAYGNSNILTDAEEENSSPLITILIAAGAVILMFLLVLAVNLLKSKLKMYRILNLPPRDCILKLYDYFIKILSMQGLGLQGGETPFQYSKRIDGFMFFSPVKFKVITDIFVKCRYSLNDASEKEKQLISDFRSSFMSETKSNMGKAKFFFLKCILGRI